MSHTAIDLKEEGNRFFVAKDFALADVKYTEAIVIDPDNPTLYANRSACRMQLKQ